MKGFIEVLDAYTLEKILINIGYIREVAYNYIYNDSNDPDNHVSCVEGYEEICKKISEAQ